MDEENKGCLLFLGKGILSCMVAAFVYTALENNGYGSDICTIGMFIALVASFAITGMFGMVDK